jgi:hypothetical protein
VLPEEEGPTWLGWSGDGDGASASATVARRSPKRRNPQLPRRLVAEVSGITNWAIEGLARFSGNGRFTIPAKMATTLNQYRRENSKTLGFLHDRVVLHRSLDTGTLPGVEVVSGDVSLTSSATT